MDPRAELLIFLALYLIIGRRIIFTAVRNIFHGVVFDENFLMVMATVVAFILGEYDEAVLVMVLYRIGEFLQDRAVDKSRRAISDLMDIRPDFANVERGNDTVTISPEEVSVGEVIVVKPGERIPLDGTVIEGRSRIDSAAITGESLPEDAEEGDRVFSGTINIDGVLRIKVSSVYSESTAARILDLIDNAAASRAKAEKFITKFARVYTPAVCGCAVLLACIPPLFFSLAWADWIHRALVFLIVSCPCALVISIPLGFFGGIGAASSRGILVKGGNYLEALSKAETVIFDKTGTLTKGVYKVVAVHPNSFSEEKLLELAAYAESFSNHPISRSLEEAYDKKIDKSRVGNFREEAGYGVLCEVDGISMCCGNDKLMRKYGIEHKDCHLQGTTVHVAADGEYIGHIIISDVLKDDSSDAIKQLKTHGIKRILMLTGDKHAVAESIAEQAGIEEFMAELLPEDKLAALKECAGQLPKGKKLAFVGDGINDAPALALADVGVAMGGMGSAAAVEAADVVLMNDKPSDLFLAVKIASKTMRIVYENIYFSIGIKLAVLILASFGIANMWLATFADVGVCILAVINSMRALRVR